MYLHEKMGVGAHNIQKDDQTLIQNLNNGYLEHYNFYNSQFAATENNWIRLKNDFKYFSPKAKKLNKTYYDIETYVKLDNTYTPFSAKFAYYEINAVAFYNNISNVAEVIYVKRPQFHKLSDEKIETEVVNLFQQKCLEKPDYVIPDLKIKITAFSDELGLLMYLFNAFKETNQHILMGYNNKNFDDPYIIKRLKKLKPFDWENIISEFGQVKSFGELSFEFPDYNMVDLLELYKPVDLGGGGYGKSLPDYTLNTVCKKVLKLEKLDINKDFVESYEDHIVEYLCYNLMDTLLVFKLDEKLTFIEKIFSLAQINNSPLGATIRGRSLMFSYRNNGHHVDNLKLIRHAKFGNEVYFKTGT